MIIDTHVHESKYSFDSSMDFIEAVKLSRLLGLDGLCITNHDNNTLREEIGDSAKINGVLVIVGAEILTFEGDILTFGLKNIPQKMISAEELLTLVKKDNGVAICAHPFRNNNRGIGDNIRKLSHLLSAVESFNGSTLPHHNLQSYALASEFEIPSIGSSDAHVLEKLGTYATRFYSTIRDHKDFIEAIKTGDFHPVMRKNGKYENIDYFYQDYINQTQNAKTI